MKTPTGQTAHDATMEDLKALVRDAEALLAGVGEQGNEKITALRERMKGALDDGREALERVKESAKEHIDDCDQYVRAHPYQAIGVAAVAGLLLGVIISRKRC